MGVDAVSRLVGPFVIARYVIDGQKFQTVSGVLREAQSRGFVGTYMTIGRRLKSGASTWAELIQRWDNMANSCVKRKAAEKAEMHALCLELDARKKALKEQS